MTVAQINRIHELIQEAGLAEDRKVNISQWTNQVYVTLHLMKANGEVWHYDINRDGTYKGELHE